MPLNVNWVKNTQNKQYFDLLRLNLGARYFSGTKGVYIIWYTSPGRSKVIRIGQGNIGERLREHINNPQITSYSSSGQLKVSWIVADNAPLRESQMDGAEAYLANKYRPMIGDRFPDVPTISVTSL